MKKIYKLLTLIIWFALVTWLAYATITVANSRKSSKIPWQWTINWNYDSAHNVWTSYSPEARFSFDSWVSAWWSSVVLDSVTWLYWQSEWVIQWSKTWDSAKTYCEGLTLWWYSDWRLPNLKELLSIVDLSKFNPAIDTTYFNVNTSRFWSSTPVASSTSRAWLWSFYGGTNISYLKASYSAYVLCLR